MSNDSNPMSKLGYGRGDDLDEGRTHPLRRHTMAYSYVDAEAAKFRDGGTPSSKLAAALAPTEMMQAVIPPATVKDLISQIAEREIKAWLAIPSLIREMMLTTPEKFTLTPNPTHPNDYIPTFSIKGMVFKWNSDGWLLVDYKD